MLRVGLTGGLASGKTYVSSLLEQHGCFVIHADQLGHEVLLPTGEAYPAVVREFGPGILDDQGHIRRSALAELVFNYPERLAVLNGLVHPSVFQREEKLMSEYAHTHPDGIAVLEAAILIETGSYRRYQRLILTVCEPEQQIARAIKRDHISREQAEARLKAQMPLAEKIPYADFVIDTSGPKEHTIQQTHEVYEALRREVV